MWFLAVVIPITARACTRLMNGVSLASSLRMRPFMLAQKLVCIGLSGAMSCHSTPNFRLQRWFGRASTGSGALISTARLQLRRLLRPGGERQSLYARISLATPPFGLRQPGRAS